MLNPDENIQGVLIGIGVDTIFVGEKVGIELGVDVTVEAGISGMDGAGVIVGLNACPVPHALRSREQIKASTGNRCIISTFQRAYVCETVQR